MGAPNFLPNDKVVSGRLTALDGHPVPAEFHVHGHDRCVVLVHGFYNSKSAPLLQGLAGELASSFDVALLDLCGHGASQGLFSWTHREWMDLEVVLRAARGRYRRVVVIGFSLGGAVSVACLARFPKLADALVCVAVPARLGEVDYRFWEKGMRRDFVYTLLTPEGRRGKGVRPGFLWGRRDRAIEKIGEVRVPVLFVHGTDDWVVKPGHSRRLFDAAREPKELKLIQGGPHAEYLLRDCREEFLQVLKSWLERVVLEGLEK